MGLIVKKNNSKDSKATIRIVDGRINVRSKYTVKILTQEEVEKERVQVYQYAL